MLHRKEVEIVEKVVREDDADSIKVGTLLHRKTPNHVSHILKATNERYCRVTQLDDGVIRLMWFKHNDEYYDFMSGGWNDIHEFREWIKKYREQFTLA